MAERYSIVRFYYPTPGKPHKPSEVQQTGLTLEEAQEHCNDPSTRQDGEWFDGYTEE